MGKQTCQNMTSWHRPQNRMYVEFLSSHRTLDQLPGVNCKTARLILPLVDDMSLMLAHLYSRISSSLQNLRPHQMPSPLQTSTSKIKASHQHSMKLGSKWANAISVISHITDIAHKIPIWRINMAWIEKYFFFIEINSVRLEFTLNIHPKKWPTANTSKWA